MSDQKRAYQKRLRAEQEEETRRRIVESAVALHGSLGPSRTTLSAIAEHAGVQRSTLYRHFADEAQVFGACSELWNQQNPLPDLASARTSLPCSRSSTVSRCSAIASSIVSQAARVGAMTMTRPVGGSAATNASWSGGRYRSST